MRHLSVVAPRGQKEDASISSRLQSELDHLLEGMESAARRLQEPAQRFLTPDDYPFLQDDYQQGSSQPPTLYAVK